MKGGGGTVYETLPEAVHRGVFFAFIFHFSGWALVAPSRFALQVPDVRGLQVPGPPCMSFFLAYFAHERNTYVHRGVY